MNSPITPSRLRDLLRALFLLVLLSVFVINVTSGSADVPGLPGMSERGWGLHPLHIDRGIAGLDLTPERRSEIDTLRWKFLAEQNRIRNEITYQRQQMLEEMRSVERTGLDSIRLKIRTLMINLRDNRDAYGRSVAALLTPEQIATLLDPDRVWGEEPALSPFATAPEEGMSYSRPHEQPGKPEE